MFSIEATKSMPSEFQSLAAKKSLIFIGKKITLKKTFFSRKCGFGNSFHISLSRADIIDNCDKWKLPRRSRQKFRDFRMSYVLGKNAYFSQEERHKQA